MCSTSTLSNFNSIYGDNIMGQFSWRTADTNKALLDKGISPRGKHNCTTKAFLLIPKEFGGGHFFVDNDKPGREYDGYGNFFDENGKQHDAYIELARWNGLLPEGFNEKDESMFYKARGNAIEKYYTPEDQNVSPYKDGNYNSLAILKYPMKITESPMPYEQAGIALDDHNHGWG